MKVKDIIKDDLDMILNYGEYDAYTIDTLIDLTACRLLELSKCDDATDITGVLENVYNYRMTEFNIDEIKPEYQIVYTKMVEEYFNLLHMKYSKIPPNVKYCIIEKIDIPYLIETLNDTYKDFETEVFKI